MSNLFTALPVPVGNGVGTPVDVSAFGGTKTITVTGTTKSQITIEFNNDAAQDGSWVALATFQTRGAVTTDVAARFMRTRVSGFDQFNGGETTCNVGSTDAGTQFVELDVPLGNGAGMPTNVSGFTGLLKTIQVGGPFRGILLVEISVDGSTDWATIASFQAPNASTSVLVAAFMRVRRVGVPVIDPGVPVVNVGITDTGQGGGGSGGATILAFTYTVTGDEPDLSEITITMPIPQESDYIAVAQCQSVTAIAGFDITDKSPTDFLLTATGNLTAGDIIAFIVTPVTDIPT